MFGRARPAGPWCTNPDLGRPTQAARIAWQLSHHPVSDGLQVLHLLCDHPWCVRPTHLVLGSQAANMADRARKQWVRACFRPRYTDRPRHDAYQTAAQVRARHRRLAGAVMRDEQQQQVELACAEAWRDYLPRRAAYWAAANVAEG